MLNKYSAIVIYRTVRNIVIIRLIKKFLEGYQDYKRYQDLRNLKILTSVDTVDIVPYVNVELTLQILSLRGGFEELSWFYALYKLMSICEKHILNICPCWVFKPLQWYIDLKKKHKFLEYAEDLAAGAALSKYLWTSLEESKSTSKKWPKFGFELDVEEFHEFLLKHGVNDEACDGFTTSVFNSLNNPHFSLKDKLLHFKLFLKYVISSDNAGTKQGLVLCLIALLLFYYFNNYALFLEMMRELLAGNRDGKVSNAFIKLIIRRLNGKGVDLEMDENLIDELKDIIN